MMNEAYPSYVPIASQALNRKKNKSNTDNHNGNTIARTGSKVNR